MKKSLLIAVAALFVAIGASAQAKRVAKLPKANLQEMKNYAVSKKVKSDKTQTMTVASPSTEKVLNNKTGRRASAAGTYIFNASSWPGEEPLFTSSFDFTIVDESGTINLDGDLYNEKTDIPFEYNVKLNDFPLADYAVYGYYDEAESTITIPVQTIFTYNADYGRIVFSACVQDGNGDPYDYGWSMVLNVNSDGTVEIDEGDFTDYIAQGYYEDGDYYIGGFWNFMPDYLNSNGSPYAWSYGFDAELFVPNATLHYATTGKSLGNDGSSNWVAVEIPAYVEDYGNEWVVSNFLGITTCSVTVNADGTCAIPFGQLMDDYNYSEYDTSYDYGYMRLVGCVLDGNSVRRDYSKTQLNGFYDNEGADFFKIEYKEAWTDEDGDHDAGYYYNDDDTDYCRYFAVATAAGSEGAYMMGWCCNLWFEFSGDVAGINAITNASANTTAKTYNLMGQEVNASTKGLVIRNGKKFLNK